MAEATDAGTELVRLDDETAARALVGQMEETELVAIEDPAVVQRSIIERILASPDAESVLGGQKAIGGKEILERPFELRGVAWHRSKYEGDLPVFAVLDVSMLDDGEQFAVTTGAGNVMAQVLRLKQLGKLPCKVKLVEAETETAAGFRPQWLVEA